jgi:hypothetical protein
MLCNEVYILFILHIDVLKLKKRMKEKVKTLLFALLFVSYSNACDVCGGAINTGGSDIIPGMYRHFIGVRGNIQHFSSEHLVLFPGEAPLLSKEWFVNSELFGRYVPVRWLHLNGFLPYNTVFKVENESHFHSTQGIGDARFSANFLLWDSPEKEDEETINEINWFSGVGVKLPTGKYHLPIEQSVHFHPNMLPGTGTFDFFGHTDLVFSRKNWGGTFNATYMYRGTNSVQYRFGDIFSSRITGFYKHNFKENHTLMLELGVFYSNIQSDEDLRWNEEQPYSEGWMVAPSIRGSYFVNDWVFQIGANKAIFQELALGQVKQNYQFELSLIRFF